MLYGGTDNRGFHVPMDVVGDMDHLPVDLKVL